ncbi:MAG: low temperature requirement protein A [Clostridia bacterium]|nr:low temperature requirement protein A [Clostridia bacterium]
MIKEQPEKKEKKVEYIELIYDLIFVYMIGRNNLILHHITNGFVDGGAFLNYILCTFAVIQMWTMTTYYINVYGQHSVRDHIMMFVNMFLLYFVGESTRSDWQDYHTQYHVAWALILINIALQYMIEYRNRRDEAEHRKRIVRMGTVILGEALLIFGAIAEFRMFETSFLSFVALGASILVTAFTGKENGKNAVDFPHLSERVMLYVVFTFGEMIIAVSSYFGEKVDLNSLYFSAMSFLIVVGLFLSYGVLYDRLIDREMKTNGIGYILTHIFIIFALNNITAALEFMRNDAVDLMAKILFITLSLILYYACFILLHRYIKTNCKPGFGFLLAAVFIGILFTGAMFCMRRQMYINIALTVIFVFALFGLLCFYAKSEEKP